MGQCRCRVALTLNPAAVSHHTGNIQLVPRSAKHRGVTLFDQFYVPRDAVIATANGYREAKAEDGPAGAMSRLTTPQDDVDALWIGHLLRWDLQMALRGNARNFTAEGVCGEQTLVWAAGPQLLQEHWRSLFPGAAEGACKCPFAVRPITLGRSGVRSSG